MTEDSVPQAFEIPPDEEPVARCPHCEHPFQSVAAKDLHLGERHPESLTEDERAAHEDAAAAEKDALFYFHLRIVAFLGVMYGFVVLLYMIALGSGFL
jgi:hypothetical protein